MVEVARGGADTLDLPLLQWLPLAPWGRVTDVCSLCKEAVVYPHHRYPYQIGGVW